MAMIGAIVNGVTNVASSFIDARKEKSAQKARIQQAKVDAEITRINNSMNTERDYDLEALRQTQYSYKDEVALLIILAPFVGSFLPWTQEYVAQGWQHLTDYAPDWYTYAFLGAIGASMGIRWAVAGFTKKK